MAHSIRRTVACLHLAGALALAGCERGPGLAEVSGAVTLDGKPLADVRVEFLPDPDQGSKGPRSTGVADADGRYSLVCDDGRSGAAIGKHRVLVHDLLPIKDEPVLSRKEEARQEGKVRAPPRPPRFSLSYAAPSGTPLRKEVKGGGQTINLELASKP